MAVVLDTDVLIEIFEKGSEKGENLLKMLEGERVATTSINLHEILYGFYRIGKAPPEEIFQLETIPFGKADADLSAKLESKLKGRLPGRFDCMIAAICINGGHRLATLNRKHFERFVPFGLKFFL